MFRWLTGLVCAAFSRLLAPLRCLTGLVCAPKRSARDRYGDSVARAPKRPRIHRRGDLVTFVHAAFKRRFTGKLTNLAPSGELWWVQYKWDGHRATTLCHPREFTT